jgi:hypothetical protein
MKFETPEEFVQEIYKASADSGTMDADIAAKYGYKVEG